MKYDSAILIPVSYWIFLLGELCNLSGGEFRLYLNRENRTKHWYFESSSLPEVVNYLEMDAELTLLLIQIHCALGCLEGMPQYVPSMEQLEDMVIRNEVCMSCAIDNYADFIELFGKY